MTRKKYPTEAVKEGKRLKSNNDIIMFRRFPNSEFVETLPAGKPSPRITGYIKKGFWAVSRNGQDLYIKDQPGVNVVEPSAKDESGFFEGFLSYISDTVGNATTGATKKAGFLQEGFHDATKGIKTDFLSISSKIKPLLFLVAAILGFWLLIKIIGVYQNV